MVFLLTNTFYQMSAHSEEKALYSSYMDNYKKDGVEIVSWYSRCNLWTVWNNDTRFRVRNKNSYDIIFKVDLQNQDEEWNRYYKEYYLSAGEIADFDATGEAWEETKDIRIAYVQ